MPMRTEIKKYDTSSTAVLDITNDVESFVASERSDGLVNVFAPHATAGLALIETGSGSERDLASVVDRLMPRELAYVHRHGSPGHGADHILPAFIAPSLTLPVEGGRILLGTWQRVVLVDFNRDNPQRKVRLSFVEG
jgi:secondary thiamine-phosphate synthase enzyme